MKKIYNLTAIILILCLFIFKFFDVPYYLELIFGLYLVAFPYNMLLPRIISSDFKQNSGAGLNDFSMKIGIFERIIIYGAGIYNIDYMLVVIGIILTFKSIMRFPEIKNGNKYDVEKYILGSFVSIVYVFVIIYLSGLI